MSNRLLQILKHFRKSAPQMPPRVMRIAFVGNPNCGKSSLFNAISRGAAKVGNYPGVTVEYQEKVGMTPSGLKCIWIDLPGTYGLIGKTPDEKITQDVLLGKTDRHHVPPDLLIAVVDAAHLERGMSLVLELRLFNPPMILVLNRMDLAEARGLSLNIPQLSEELGIPVIPTVATQKKGLDTLLQAIEKIETRTSLTTHPLPLSPSTEAAIRARFVEVDRILTGALTSSAVRSQWTIRLDRILLHPLWGSLILLGILSLIFQAIFDWAELPMRAIESGMEILGFWLQAHMTQGPLRSLLMGGVLAGVGSTLVFLPQILLLFLFIFILEDSGYMSRAAFLMDRIMRKVGLHGRAFIPLLSSFACAVPGILATRTIESRKDRLATLLMLPLVTCSARLPVYTLLISAFIPNRTLWFGLHLQGVVMLSLYLLGTLIAVAVAALLRVTLLKGPQPPLLMELPTYQWPHPRTIGLALFERAKIFVQNAGSVILSLSILLWFFVSYPTHSDILHSYAGQLGHAIEPLLRPLGLNWKIAVALIPSFAAREVMVGALATVYAVEGEGEQQALSLAHRLAEEWSIATGLSLIVWYVLACQCLSTLAVIRRETDSWRWPGFTLVYMTVLAYIGSWMTYQVAVQAGLG